jgi:hypothetical protein
VATAIAWFTGGDVRRRPEIKELVPMKLRTLIPAAAAVMLVAGPAMAATHAHKAPAKAAKAKAARVAPKSK